MSIEPPAPWTPEQWDAITRRGCTLLVSAAAGSGKTAVLVQRIILRIMDESDPVDVDRLLVVTFTDAAAAEMRRRIGQALEEKIAAEPSNEHVRRQLALLPRATISTIHSFCRSVLRQYFHRIGLDPRFGLMDEQEALLLQHDALDGVLARAYAAAQPGDPFTVLAGAATAPEGDERLRRIVTGLYAFARSLPDPVGWLHNLPGPDSVDTIDAFPWLDDLRRWLRRELTSAHHRLQQALRLANGPGGVAVYVPTLERELEQLERLLASVDGPWASMEAAFRAASFARLPGARGDDFDPEVRDLIKDGRTEARDIVRDVQATLFSRDEAAHLQDMAEARPVIEALSRLTLDFHEEYSRLKQERSLLDFSDLEHHCLSLLTADRSTLAPSPVAQELRSRFVEVLVDEYQDINGVQDAILRLVSRPAPRPADGDSATEGASSNLFLVGDVKQSIYRFRAADPGLFLQRHARSVSSPGLCENPAEGALDKRAASPEVRIDLQANFRSRRPVLDAVNYVFRHVMTEDVGEMDYDKDAELVYGAGYPAEDPPVEFHLVEQTVEPGTATGEAALFDDGAPAGIADLADWSAFEREALVVARRLRQLLDEQTPIWDKDANAYRPIRPRDVAVLLRATRHKAPMLVDILGRFGIPAYADLGTGYFAATEVDTMLALLSLIENPRQDIPLAAVLRSPIVGLRPAELARIRLAAAQASPKRAEPSLRGSAFYDAVVAVSEMEDEPLAPRLRDFLTRLDGWRTEARRGPLGDLIHHIYLTTRIVDYVAALPGGRQREANLHALYERARQFDRFHQQGLSRFLRFIRRLQAAEGDLGTAPALSEDDDVVRVMSVHQSKGLEFPVAVVMDVGRDFDRSRGHGDLFLYHRELGAGAMSIDPHRRILYPTLAYLALRERRRQEETAEEMRILYVALTRARERLIIVGSTKDVEATCAQWRESLDLPPGPLPEAWAAQARRWLDWIGPALVRHPDAAVLRGEEEPAPSAAAPSLWDITLWDLSAPIGEPVEEKMEDVSSEETEAEKAGVENSDSRPSEDDALEDGAETTAAEGPKVNDVLASLEERLAWTYPWAPLTEKAAKVSATEVKRWWAAEDEDEESASLVRRRPTAFRPFRPAAKGAKREKKRTLSAAEKGAATHLALQWLDLRAPLNAEAIANQLIRLQLTGRITEEQREAVNVHELAAFFASPLGRRLQEQAALERPILREVPFTLVLPAGEFYSDLPPDVAADEYVLTQGIIDLLAPLREGMVLIDFKTDRLPPGASLRQAAERYRGQMMLYMRAVREMYGEPPHEAYVVFLSAGEAVSVTELGFDEGV